MSLLCPACQTDLVMAERQGVEIDYCPKCRGVWLDRGELDKIVERAGAGPARAAGVSMSTPERKHDQDTDDDDDDRWRRSGRPPGKRKSWLSDIFD